MDRLQKELKQNIKELLNKGYSASNIAKSLHKRKQTILDAVRDITSKSKNVKKITNLKGQKGSNNLDYATQRFTDVLYKQGYPIEYIVKLVNVKHPDNSKNKIRKYIQQLKNDNAILTSHKGNMNFYKSSSQYKQHLDGKYYRETDKHYFKEFKNQFKEGSPTIEYEIEGGAL